MSFPAPNLLTSTTFYNNVIGLLLVSHQISLAFLFSLQKKKRSKRKC